MASSSSSKATSSASAGPNQAGPASSDRRAGGRARPVQERRGRQPGRRGRRGWHVEAVEDQGRHVDDRQLGQGHAGLEPGAPLREDADRVVRADRLGPPLERRVGAEDRDDARSPLRRTSGPARVLERPGERSSRRRPDSETTGQPVSGWRRPRSAVAHLVADPVIILRARTPVPPSAPWRTMWIPWLLGVAA